jgi:polyphosphate kinase 2 (PPK2 family)
MSSPISRSPGWLHEQIAIQPLAPAAIAAPIVGENSIGMRLACLSDIVHFEDYLTRQGTLILKFFLYLSRKEQKKRFMERLDRLDKHWKFSASDVHEREFWGDYMHAFQEAIRATASKRAPWYVVPADNKWFTRLIVAAAIVEAMEKLDLAYPTVDAKKNKELQAARAALSEEK